MKIEITKDTTFAQIERLQKLLNVQETTHVQYGTEHVVEAYVGLARSNIQFRAQGRSRELTAAYQDAFRKAYERQPKCELCGRVRGAHEQGICPGPMNGWEK